MNEKVQQYKKKLEKQLNVAEGRIALYERSKSRILMKLKDVEESFAREIKNGSVKVSKIAGISPSKKSKVVPGANVEVKTIEIPTVEMDLPAAPAPAPKEKEKSKLTFW